MKAEKRNGIWVLREQSCKVDLENVAVVEDGGNKIGERIYSLFRCTPGCPRSAVRLRH